jgi:RNA polymerase sigma factor (sigma-70 family)
MANTTIVMTFISRNRERRSFTNLDDETNAGALSIIWEIRDRIANTNALGALYTVICNNLRNQYFRTYFRSNQCSLNSETLPEEPQSREKTASQIALQHEQHCKVHDALKDVSADANMVIEMHLVHGMTFREIGEKLKKSENTVSSLFRRARLKLLESPTIRSVSE